MIVHIALFKWKDEVSAEDIEHVMVDVRGLKDKVEGIIDIFCGRNFSVWNKGFTHALVVLTVDQLALDIYRKHPSHQEIVQKTDRMEADSIGMDFEANEPSSRN